MAGLSAAGFERKRLPQIRTEIEDFLKQSFGEDIDLRPESVFGQLVGTFSLPIAELWEEAENVWLAFDPEFSDGVSLDSLASLTGVTRLSASSTFVTAALRGTASTVVPAGSQARNEETGEIYSLTGNVIISSASLLRTVVSVNTVSNSTTYTITINGTPYSINSGVGATANSILQLLSTAIDANPLISPSVVGNELTIAAANGSLPFSAGLTSNLTFSTLESPGYFVAIEAGAKLLPAGLLSAIQTPVAGWTSIDNLTAGTTGRNRETDAELRVRRRQSVSFPATATIDAILSRLLQVENVFDAGVLQNTGTVTDSNGVPPQHIWAIVRGGAAADVAQVLYQTTAGGIGTFGEETVTITSDSGQDYDFHFSRAVEVPVYISIAIEKTDDFPVDGEDLIKAAVVEWVNANIGISDRLKYSRLFTPINTIGGFEVTDMFIGIAPAPTETDSIDVDDNEVIVVTPANIVITEV